MPAFNWITSHLQRKSLFFLFWGKDNRLWTIPSYIEPYSILRIIQNSYCRQISLAIVDIEKNWKEKSKSKECEQFHCAFQYENPSWILAQQVVSKMFPMLNWRMLCSRTFKKLIVYFTYTYIVNENLIYSRHSILRINRFNLHEWNKFVGYARNLTVFSCDPNHFSISFKLWMHFISNWKQNTYAQQGLSFSLIADCVWNIYSRQTMRRIEAIRRFTSGLWIKVKWWILTLPH